MTRTLFVTVALLSYTGFASAHDLWLIPPESNPRGKEVTVRAISGMKFPKGEHAPDPTKFARRLVMLPNGQERELKAGAQDQDAGLLQFDSAGPGVYAIAIETKPRLINLDPAKFNAYLVSDGLPHIFLMRSKEGTLDQPGRERYSKSPKALFKIGDGKGDPTKPVGLPLEIVPLKDPFALKAGGALKVRVLFREKPLTRANLGWDHPSEGELPAGTALTDEKGEALIPVVKSGLMTIRLTHMTRPKAADYEWESFWTSLTLRVPE
jgi:uncharacterized GH25 family protein